MINKKNHKLTEGKPFSIWFNVEMNKFERTNNDSASLSFLFPENMKHIKNFDSLNEADRFINYWHEIPLQ